MTSNLHPARFDTILPKRLATATVDRLFHHAHVIVTDGRSQRRACLSGTVPLKPMRRMGDRDTHRQPAGGPHRLADQLTNQTNVA